MKASEVLFILIFCIFGIASIHFYSEMIYYEELAGKLQILSALQEQQINISEKQIDLQEQIIANQDNQIIELKTEVNRLTNRLSQYIMHDKDLIVNDSYKTTGIYYPAEEVMAVWIDNRLEENINKTIDHEVCHHFIKKDFKHFCSLDWKQYYGEEYGKNN